MTLVAILLFIIGASKVFMLLTGTKTTLDIDNLHLTEKQSKIIGTSLVSIDAIIEMIAGLFILSL